MHKPNKSADERRSARQPNKVISPRNSINGPLLLGRRLLIARAGRPDLMPFIPLASRDPPFSSRPSLSFPPVKPLPLLSHTDPLPHSPPQHGSTSSVSIRSLLLDRRPAESARQWQVRPPALGARAQWRLSIAFLTGPSLLLSQRRGGRRRGRSPGAAAVRGGGARGWPRTGASAGGRPSSCSTRPSGSRSASASSSPSSSTRCSS